jgi:hypothetical protein
MAKRVIKSGSDKAISKLLLASAVVLVTTLYTICNPTCVPNFAQTVKVSKLPAVRNSATAPQPKGQTILASGRHQTGTKAPEVKTSKSENGFMVPPPPATPCVLPPEFDLLPMQPGQKGGASQQQLKQAQAQASSKTDNEDAAGEKTPQQSDPELQAADEELEAALRSSLRTVGEWTR